MSPFVCCIFTATDLPMPSDALQNKAILSARNTILFQWATPCIVLSYRNIPSFNGIVIYIYEWKGSLLYKNLNNTTLSHTLSQGLLCVLKATFSKECYTLFERNIVYTFWKEYCVYMYVYIYIQ
jgi:hypothetical protein